MNADGILRLRQGLSARANDERGLLSLHESCTFLLPTIHCYKWNKIRHDWSVGYVAY
jgi:hypothetical protein